MRLLIVVAVVLFPFLFGEGFANAATFRGLSPGESQKSTVHQRLGSAGREFVLGVEYFAPGPAGVSEALAAFGENNRLRWLWLRLSAPLPPDTMRAALGLSGFPALSPGHPLEIGIEEGSTASYRYDHVFLYKQKGMVNEVILVNPDDGKEDIRREIGALLRRLSSPEHSPDPLTARVSPPTGSETDMRRPLPPDFHPEMNGKPGTAPHTGDDIRRPLARLQVFSIRTENVIADNGEHGLSILAHVEAEGLNGHELTGIATLRLPGGSPVKAAQGAHPHFRGGAGEVRAGSRDRVLHDNSRWLPFRLFIPYSAMILPENTGRAIVSFSVACGGFSAAMTAEAPMPINLYGPPLVFGTPGGERAIILGPVTMLSESLPDGRDALSISTELTANGMPGEKITLTAQLLLSGDRRRVLAKAAASDTIRYQQAQWAGFRIMIPRDTIPFQSNTPHRVILVLTAECGGLTGSLERELILLNP